MCGASRGLAFGVSDPFEYVTPTDLEETLMQSLPLSQKRSHQIYLIKFLRSLFAPATPLPGEPI